MKVKFTKEEARRIEFEMSGFQLYFANAVRRFAMSRVPTMAIDSVTVYENSSSSFDEYIANRLGLIPLKAPLGYAPKAGFSLLSLDKTGPVSVYSSDIKSLDPKVKMAIPNIPLLKLLEHQNIRLEAKALSGIGLKHAKFQPCLAAYDEKGPESFSFFVESFSQLPARTILHEAAGILLEKSKELEKALSELK